MSERVKRGAVAGLVAAVLLAGAGGTCAQQVQVDPAVKPYQPVPGISGTLNGKGSDTLNNLMQMWMEAFRKHYPTVQATYTGEGSGVATPALIEGTAQLGPMSRKMKAAEQEAIEKAFGVKPTEVAVALDCVAVFVHKDNPVRGLTIPQLDCIFSSTRNSGYADVTKWGQVGLAHEPHWRDLPISMVGRNSVSGTYAFFKEKALLKGDFKNSVKEQPGSASVVNAVAADRGAIGYTGIGYKTADVRAIRLSKDEKTPLADPTFANALSGKYPLGRALYVYVVKKPNEPLPPLVLEFMKLVLSKQGQEIVVQDGFGPLPPDAIEAELKKLD